MLNISSILKWGRIFFWCFPNPTAIGWCTCKWLGGIQTRLKKPLSRSNVSARLQTLLHINYFCICIAIYPGNEARIVTLKPRLFTAALLLLPETDTNTSIRNSTWPDSSSQSASAFTICQLQELGIAVLT